MTEKCLVDSKKDLFCQSRTVHLCCYKLHSSSCLNIVSFIYMQKRKYFTLNVCTRHVDSRIICRMPLQKNNGTIATIVIVNLYCYVICDAKYKVSSNIVIFDCTINKTFKLFFYKLQLP